ncbi:helix-turn-helix domain-containing protein [Vreelandella aquamarina]|uniref:helix-turn-helix domain-containing protein n=1 Tax=Vreelandella aquamarina TaxID=77097 RepID=UPI00384D2064
MMQNIQSQNESWQLTKNFGEAGATTSSTRSNPSARIYNIEKHLYPEMNAPKGYKDISDIIAKSEQNPARKAALEKARANLAKQHYGDEGQTVRTARLQLGLSQSVLADMINTSQPHIARIEKGTENLTLETMRKLCKALHVNMNQLDEMLHKQKHAWESKKK